MGSVKLNNLKNTNKDEIGFTFVDLHLDVKETKVLTDNKLTSLQGPDLKASYDEEAIKNSLINIFNTIPGERFLIPEFGTNLLQYIFQPVTEATARAIGNSILNTIERWEPRVIVENVNVVGNPNINVIPKNTGKFSTSQRGGVGEHEYIVNVIVSIPKLKRRVKLDGILTEGGFAETKLV